MRITAADYDIWISHKLKTPRWAEKLKQPQVDRPAGRIHWAINARAVNYKIYPTEKAVHLARLVTRRTKFSDYMKKEYDGRRDKANIPRRYATFKKWFKKIEAGK